MPRLTVTVSLVLVVIYLVPFPIYGAASAIWGLQPPGDVSPARFMLGVLITKLGIAVAFAALFYANRNFWWRRWFAYGLIWFLMFASSEFGEAVAGRTSPLEAVLGVISEAVYAPLAAWIAQRMLRPQGSSH